MTIRTQRPYIWSVPPGGGAPVRRFIDALAKWAVASSMAAGCGAHYTAEPAPKPTVTAGSAGSRIENSAGRPAMAGSAGEGGMAGGEGGAGAGGAGVGPVGVGMAGSIALNAGSAAPKPPEPRQPPQPLCAGTDSWFLADVDLRDGDDYAWLNLDGTVIEEVGTACERAMDSRVCLTDLEELKKHFTNTGAPVSPPPPPVLVTTSSDGLATFIGGEAIIDYLRPIDRIGEAKLVLVLAGRALPHCVGSNNGASSGRIVPVDGGFEVDTAGAYCQVSQLEKIDENGTITVVRNPSGCIVDGRLPPGFEFTAPRAAGSALGAYFARAAQFEAASVHAFARLAEELESLRAPARLIGAARRAVRDEARHAEQMSAWARRFGAEPAPVVVHPTPARSAFEIALDNALEGCVGETHAALIASHQALAARHAGVRVTMASIARDEASHAELAWSLARWLEPRLPPRERALIDAARRDALARLSALADGAELDAEERAAAGLPEPELARALAERLRDGLSSPWLAAAS